MSDVVEIVVPLGQLLIPNFRRGIWEQIRKLLCARIFEKVLGSVDELGVFHVELSDKLF
jgi:hypothetical protein